MFLEALFLHSLCVTYKGHAMDCTLLQGVSWFISWGWTLWETQGLWYSSCLLPGATGLPGSSQEKKKKMCSAVERYSLCYAKDRGKGRNTECGKEGMNCPLHKSSLSCTHFTPWLELI